MQMGKLAPEELKELLKCIKSDKRVFVPPLSGYDSGVHLIGDKYMVVSTDPCISVPEKWFGWLLIHYAASDVALFGAKPEFCTVNLLGPLGAKMQLFHEVMRQACNAASELDVAIVTGHTGTYAGLSKLVGVCTAYGTITKERLITPGNAKAGDYILCTKAIGLETLVNFALTHEALAHRLFGVVQTNKLVELVPLQSCVREALCLARTGVVHAMHDATEGGLVAALNEMAEASQLGFKVNFENIPIPLELQKLQEKFGLSDEQVLSMSSTGTLLAAVDARAKDKVRDMLQEIGISVSYLGVFTARKDRILVNSGVEKSFPLVADDPYDRILLSPM
ncbi:MAG: AIR synthase-related protein [Candidatus Bathyarchaeia archaeon]